MRRIGCYREWLRPGENALAFDDRAGLIQAVERLASDRALRDRLAAASRQMAALHRLERVGARLREIYERALSI